MYVVLFFKVGARVRTIVNDFRCINLWSISKFCILVDEREKEKISFSFFAIFPFSVRQRVLSVVLREMSAVRKLCSLMNKSSRSIVTLKKRDFFTANIKTLKRDNVHLMTNCQNLHNVNHIQVSHYSQALGSLTKDQAHDLVFRLNEEERTMLYNTLEQFQMKEDKQKMECESHFHYTENWWAHPFSSQLTNIQSQMSVKHHLPPSLVHDIEILLLNILCVFDWWF